MTRHYPSALVWLRRDLRLEDQAALSRALSEADQVTPVFLFDTAILDPLPRAAGGWSSSGRRSRA